MSAGFDGSIRINTSVDASGMAAGTKKITAGLSTIMGSLTKMGALIGVVFGAKAVIDFGKGAVSAAMELESALMGLQSVVSGQGRSFNEAKKFIDSYIKDGLIPAADAITAYKNLASRGYNDDQIQQTLLRLKDAAAFGRQSSLTIGEAVRGASEGLRQENSLMVDNAGVTKNVAKMWDDYAESIGTTADKLTQAQKIQAEVNGILQETRFQTGDAAKIAGGLAGKIAVMVTAWNNFKVAAGKAIQPLLERIIPIITRVIEKMTLFANQVGQAMRILFGSSETEQTAAGMQKVADNTEAAAGQQGDLADGIEDAEKAAKGALASFDELNVLQLEDKKAPEVTEAGLPEVAAVAPDEPLTEENFLSSGMITKLEELRGKLEHIKETFEQEGFWAGLKEAWDVLWGDYAYPFIEEHVINPLKARFEVLWEQISPKKKWEKFQEDLKTNWEQFKKNIQDPEWWVNNVGRPLQTAFGNAVKTSQMIWTIATTWFEEKVAIPIREAFEHAWNAVKLKADEVWDGIQSRVDKAWEAVKQRAGEAWEKTQAAWNGASTWFQTNVVDNIKASFASLVDSSKTNFENARTKALDAWGNVKTWFAENVGDKLKEMWSKLPDSTKENFSNAWTNAREAWQGASEWFKTNVSDKVKTAFSDMTTWMGNKWQDVFGVTFGDSVKNAFNVIIDLINGFLAKFAAGVNGMIGVMNTLSFKAPDWIPGFGGQAWGVNLPLVAAPQIPRLATGAVIPPNAKFAAILGDQRSGRNLEAPEGLIRQIIREELGTQKTEVSVNFQGSLGALVRELKPVIDAENKRVGGNLITSGSFLK